MLLVRCGGIDGHGKFESMAALAVAALLAGTGTGVAFHSVEILSGLFGGGGCGGSGPLQAAAEHAAQGVASKPRIITSLPFFKMVPKIADLRCVF